MGRAAEAPPVDGGGGRLALGGRDVLDDLGDGIAAAAANTEASACARDEREEG